MSLQAVEALVRDAASITSIPSNLSPPLSAASANVPSSVLPGAGGCVRPTKPCSFGAVTAKKTVLLVGDSHALMWAPAVSGAGTTLRFHLELAWHAGCPFVLTPDLPSCTSFKGDAFGTISRLKPTVVVLAERTTDAELTKSDASWTADLEGVLRQYRHAGSRVVLIGDNPLLPTNPIACLARFPTAVQTCAGATLSRTGKPTTRSLDEAAAARAVPGVIFVDPTPWLCTATCSPIIGSQIAYYDLSHLSGTYAASLAGVMAASIAPALQGHP